MKEKRKYIVTMKEEDMTLEAKVIFSNEAIYGCKDGDVIPDVAVSLLGEAGVVTYILNKKLGDRFTIASSELKTVVTGIVTDDDEKDIQLLITNVYGGVFFTNGAIFSEYIID